MKVKHHDGGDLRLILAGVASDPVVCARVASQWNGELFDDEDANLIAGWCVRHFTKYGQPPNGRLRGIFQNWSSKPATNEKRAQAVEEKLITLSRELKTIGPINCDYVLDRAIEYFNKVRFRKVHEEVEQDLDRGDTAEAYAKMTGVSRLALEYGTTTRLVSDYEAWRDCLDEENEKPLLAYSGALDRFLGPFTARENFIAFMAPDKSGKSYWLMDAGFRGIRAGWRVAMFEVGDMTRKQIMRRMAARFAKRPILAKKYKVPISIDEEAEIEWKNLVAKERLSPGQVFRVVQKTLGGRDQFRLECRPACTINVEGIRSILLDWARGGWVADVVLVDYADILAPPAGIRDPLEQIDRTWMGLRRLSQEFHCLVATATQTKATAYNMKSKVLSREHFSGRKTKLAHVTGMIGLNVTEEFRSKCVTGLNWVVQREGAVSEKRMLLVAGCLDIGNPAMKSHSPRRKENQDSVEGS